MAVYNIVKWRDPKTIFDKLFDIFDIDKDNHISKKEMEQVMVDLTVLFEDPKQARNIFENAFEEMDKNGDGRVTREEFLTAVMENNKFSQTLATKVLDIFLQ